MWRHNFLGLVFDVPLHRNNHITSVIDFLQPRFCLLIPTQQNLLSVANGLRSSKHTSSPMPKTAEISKDFISVCKLHVDFHIRTRGKCKSLPFTAWVILLQFWPMYASHLGASKSWRSPIRYPSRDYQVSESSSGLPYCKSTIILWLAEQQSFWPISKAIS